MEERFTRETFYDLIWSQSVAAVSKAYRISTTDVRKICKKYDVPIPKNGYWQKKKYNKPVDMVPLLEIENAPDSEIVLIVRDPGDADIPFFLSERNKKLYEVQNDPNFNFTVPDKLSNPHPLITQSLKTLS